MQSKDTDEEDGKPASLPTTGPETTMTARTDAAGSTRTSGGGVKTSTDKWENMLEQLLRYKNEHGNTLVPNRYPKLGNWVSTQRRYYKARQKGQTTPLSDNRLKKLESVGFVWATTDPRHVPWEMRYQQLVEYKSRFGDCRVPMGFEENVQLANWVSTQRQEWRSEKAGRSSRLTLEKIKMLDDIGFTWRAPRGGVRRRKAPSAVAHVAIGKRNHDSSSSSEDEQTFMCTTKSLHDTSRKKMKTPLISSDSPTPIAKPWMTLFQDYITQRDQHAHNKVQDPESSYPHLQEWCSVQRARYRKWKENPDQSNITQEQINLLNSIQFDWKDKSASKSSTKNEPQVSFTSNSSPAFVSPSRIPSNFTTGVGFSITAKAVVTPASSRSRRNDTSTSDAVDALVALRKSSMEDNEDPTKQESESGQSEKK